MVHADERVKVPDSFGNLGSSGHGCDLRVRGRVRTLGYGTRFHRPLHGFTLIELLVVVAILSLLLAMLVPSLQAVRVQAERAICSNHLQSVNNGLLAYVWDNDRYFPPARYLAYAYAHPWYTDYLAPYIGEDLGIVTCPAELRLTGRDDWARYRYNTHAFNPPPQVVDVWPERAAWGRFTQWQDRLDVVFSFADFHEPWVNQYTIHPPAGPSVYAGLGVTLGGEVFHYNEFSTSTDADWYLHWQALP